MPSLSAEPYPFRDLHPHIRRAGRRLRAPAHVLGHRPHAHALHLLRVHRRSSPSTCRGSRARISSGSWAAASASGWAGRMTKARLSDEIHLVQPDAVAVPARRLPREEPLGVGRHPQHALRSAQGPPRLPRVHGPARVRRDARLRRHRRATSTTRTATGSCPRPNLIAAGLARRTSRAAICVIGNSIAGYNPPIRVAEEFAMLDVISGGRLVAGFPVGTPMDTNFCYGQIPALTRDKYGEAHDLIMKAWAERRAVRLRRQVQPAPLGQLLAQADPEAAPADLHPGRRLDRDVGLLPRPRLQLLVPVVLRLPARQVAARRLLGARGQARQGRLALPRRLRPDHLRRRHRRRGRASSTPSTSSTSSTAACTCSRPSPTRPATARSTRSSTARSPSSRMEPAEDLRRTSPGSSWWTSASSSPAARRRCASSSRSASRALRVGHLFCLLPQRQHAGLEDAPLDQALRREGHAPPARPLAGVEARRPLVDPSHGRSPAPRGVAGPGAEKTGAEWPR